jgi:hypothetical protein
MTMPAAGHNRADVEMPLQPFRSAYRVAFVVAVGSRPGCITLIPRECDNTRECQVDLLLLPVEKSDMELVLLVGNGRRICVGCRERHSQGFETLGRRVWSLREGYETRA